jgi:hypothetical protein
LRVKKTISPVSTPPNSTSEEIGKRKLPPAIARKTTHALQTARKAAAAFVPSRNQNDFGSAGCSSVVSTPRPLGVLLL